MTLSKNKISFSIFSILFLFFLHGCVQTLSLITIPVTVAQLGATAYQSIEKADIDAAVTSGVTKKELNKIQNVAIFLGQENTEPPFGRIGDLGAVVGDNLCVELTKLGFKVYEGSKLRKLTKAGYSTKKIANAGKKLGAQAIVTGNITAGQNRSFGMLGIGRMNTVVQSVSMKIIGVRKANTLMIITINYKIGQNPRVAAEGMAMVLKTKLEDPTLNVEELFKKEKIG
ncbi:MAG: hypothetical protein J7J07_09205 [Syntrophobacterales bacterium]|nr:hypothetical protein [Syntrophobacterales bacterium]